MTERKQNLTTPTLFLSSTSKGTIFQTGKGWTHKVTEDEVNVDTTNADSSKVLNRTSQHTFVEGMDKQCGI